MRRPGKVNFLIHTIALPFLQRLPLYRKEWPAPPQPSAGRSPLYLQYRYFLEIGYSVCRLTFICSCLRYCLAGNSGLSILHPSNGTVMKLHHIVASAIGLWFSFLSYGQSAQEQKPVVTKGYYAIGDHSKKLTVYTIPLLADSAPPAVSKGYYSTTDSAKRPAKKWGWLLRQRARPVTTKGYYSIGNK